MVSGSGARSGEPLWLGKFDPMVGGNGKVKRRKGGVEYGNMALYPMSGIAGPFACWVALLMVTMLVRSFGS